MLREEKLKGVREQQDSFVPKVKFVFLVFTQQENSRFFYFVILLQSLKVFF
jgi:hypothetical protein